VFLLLDPGPSGVRSPGHGWSPAGSDARSARSGPLARGALARASVGRAEVKVPPVEPFTPPVPMDFAQDVMDARLAQVDPEKMA
jgi:hypothetical protein